MAKAALKALLQFNAGGKEYLPGDVFPLADVDAWPEGSLERRFSTGYCTTVAVSDPAPGKPKADSK